LLMHTATTESVSLCVRMKRFSNWNRRDSGLRLFAA
jgi:hypothetical protein